MFKTEWFTMYWQELKQAQKFGFSEVNIEWIKKVFPRIKFYGYEWTNWNRKVIAIHLAVWTFRKLDFTLAWINQLLVARCWLEGKKRGSMLIGLFPPSSIGMMLLTAGQATLVSLRPPLVSNRDRKGCKRWASQKLRISPFASSAFFTIRVEKSLNTSR